MVPTDFEYYIALPLTAICSVLGTILSIHLCHTICNDKKKKRSWYYSFYVVSILFGSLAIYNNTLIFYASYFLDDQDDNLFNYKYINVSGDIFSFFGINIFYIIALWKIYEIFLDTISIHVMY